MIYKKKFIIYLCCTLLWMGGIFFFSAQPSKESDNTSLGVGRIIAEIFIYDFEELSEEEQYKIVHGWNGAIRKTAHFTEYAILGVLCALALMQLQISKKYVGITGAIFCVLYAVSDELHQYFVPGRACQFGDVCIDSAGAVVGVMAVMWIAKQRRKQKYE